MRSDSYLFELLRVYIGFPEFVVGIELCPDEGILEEVFVFEAKKSIFIDSFITPEVSNEALGSKGDKNED